MAGVRKRTLAAKLIHSWRTREKSTEPKTPEGKARVSRNTYKGGHWKLARALREQKMAVQDIDGT